MTDKVLEGRLRPRYEFISIFASALSLYLTWVASDAVGMSTSFKVSATISMIAICVFRFRQAINIKKYQKSLTKIDAFFVKADDIPTPKSKLWIGKGFEWGPKHTQRLHDAKKQEAQKYSKPSNLFRKIRNIEAEAEQEKKEGMTTWKTRLSDITKKQSFNLYGLKIKNPYAPLPPVGGESMLHAVGAEDETDQYLDLGERYGHTLVAGTTRCGKSRLLEILVSQDIKRNDGAVVVIDPKGDAAMLANMYLEARRQNRESDFYVFHLGYPDISARYNAIASFSKVTEIATRIANQMDTGGDAVFKDFAWRFFAIIAKALFALGEKADFKNVKRYLSDPEQLYIRYVEKWMDKNIENWEEIYEKTIFDEEKYPRTGGRIVAPKHLAGRQIRTIGFEAMIDAHIKLHPNSIDDVTEGLRSTIKNDITYYNKITASALPFLEKLTSGRTAELIVPDYKDARDEREIINWDKILRRNGICYIGLAAMTDNEVAGAVGSMFFSDLLSKCGDIYLNGKDKGLMGADREEKPQLWLHCDEFSDLVGDKNFLSILNKSGGSGTRLTCYSQTRADLEAKVGDAPTSLAMEGNFNNLIMLRVKSKYTAEMLIDQIKTCDKYGLDTSSSTTNKDLEEEEIFSTRSQAVVSIEATEPMISADDVINLPKGQAFALIEGAKLVKLRFPLLAADDSDKPPSLQEMIDKMAEKYQTTEDWWSDEKRINLKRKERKDSATSEDE